MPPLFRNPGGSNPRQQLLMLVAGALVVVMLMVKAQRYAGMDGGGYPGPMAQTMMLADPGGAPDPFAQVKARPEIWKSIAYDYVLHDDRNKAAAADLTRYQVPLDVVFGHLKTKTQNDLAKQAWPRTRWTHAKVMEHTERWRFETLHVFGLLLHKEIVELPEMSPGLRKLYKLILYDNRRHLHYTILTPQVPADARAVKGNDRPSWIAADGVLLMRHPYMAEGGWRSTPLICARRAYHSNEWQNVPMRLDERDDPGVTYKQIRPATVAPGLDVDFVRRNMFAPPKVQRHGVGSIGVDIHTEAANLLGDKPALDHVFSYLYGQTDESLARQVHPDLDYVTLQRGNEPAPWMIGKILRVRAVAAFVRTFDWSESAEEMPEEFASDITRIHLVFGQDKEYIGSKYVWALACLNLPEGLQENDTLEAVGAFVKLYPYRTRENRWLWAPLVVCRELRRVPADEQGQLPEEVYWTIGALILLMALTFVWVSNRDTEDLAAVRQRSLARRLERQHKPARLDTAAPSPDAGADDALSGTFSSPSGESSETPPSPSP